MNYSGQFLGSADNPLTFHSETKDSASEETVIIFVSKFFFLFKCLISASLNSNHFSAFDYFLFSGLASQKLLVGYKMPGLQITKKRAIKYVKKHFSYLLRLYSNQIMTAKSVLDKLKKGSFVLSGLRGGGRSPPPLRDSTPSRPKGSPLCTISKYPFLAD